MPPVLINPIRSEQQYKHQIRGVDSRFIEQLGVPRIGPNHPPRDQQKKRFG